EIGVVAGVELAHQPRQNRGVARQALEAPGERGGRGLVPGEEQGDELVAQLLVGRGLAGLIRRSNQQRKDVATGVEARVRPALADLRVEELVRRGGRAVVAPPRTEALELRAEPHKGQRWVEVDDPWQERSELTAPLLGVDADDHA